MDRRQKTRYLIAIYVIVILIAVIFVIFAFLRDADTLQSLFLNLSTELLGVAFIFF